jgi:cytochrome P450
VSFIDYKKQHHTNLHRHETTASAFTWVTYLLATNSELQTKLREEVREAIPFPAFSDSQIDIAGILERLPLLNGVCNETLRLYPTVPITMRIALRETRLLDHRIPRGTEILLSPWAVNRSPELWGEHADKFMPERWIDDGKPNNSGGSFSNYSQLTFLHGPRSCIGQNFAKAELRCIVAAFVCVFGWTLDMKDEDVVPAGIVTIKPKNGLHLKLTPLGRW